MINGELEESEIREGNELILKFEGFIKCLEGGAWRKDKEIIQTKYVSYNLSYSSLMPVVEKIGNLNINGYTPYLELTNFGCSISFDKNINLKTFRCCHGETLLIDIWIMVVKFLDWYLNLKK